MRLVAVMVWRLSIGRGFGGTLRKELPALIGWGRFDRLPNPYKLKRFDTMKNLTIDQLARLLEAKREQQARLPFMKNRESAKELATELEAEIYELTRIAREKMKTN